MGAARLAAGVAALALVLGGSAASTATEPVTFNNQVVRLFQAHCQTCHRPGDIAPFPLVTYGDAYPNRRKILRVTQKRTMPPWKPVPGFGEFLGRRRLSEMHAIAITPHMHLLGREMKVTATMPDGTTRPLIYIDDWDFHWQGSYTFTEPVALPGGTRIDVRAVYDNSTANPRTPHTPPRPVSWGEGTTDEMCIAFLRVTVDSERLGVQPR